MVLMTTLMSLKSIIPVEKKSGMLVQDPFKANDIDAIFNQASQAEAVERAVEHLRPSSSSRSFTGTARLLSDDGPLPRLDDPANASFLESIGRSECPRELQPANKGAAIHVNLLRKEENYTIYRGHLPFQGVGRTLDSSSNITSAEPTVVVSSLITAPAPTTSLVVDQTTTFYVDSAKVGRWYMKGIMF
ncbi:unnamed protein product [Coffea canephora]|uniref:SEP domain-containing protein n=1 Tax=Coffea canephora TaxID=49390 RepID=A0A068USP5_COFCA|nr:unnamed protein product [Coffea canephora]